jgi:hypothetical protein
MSASTSASSNPHLRAGAMKRRSTALSTAPAGIGRRD